jgi:hypothetical protein
MSYQVVIPKPVQKQLDSLLADHRKGLDVMRHLRVLDTFEILA